MALNPQKIRFFLEQIQNGRMQTFGSEVKHLFDHIDTEVKENPIYDKYEKERVRWAQWPGENFMGSGWVLPPNFEDTKSLTYDLYKTISEKPEQGYALPSNLTYGNGDINDAIYTFNSQFFGYFQEVLQEIVNANPEIESSEIERVDGDKVFIIHGHDNTMKAEVQLLLTRGGVNNIVLHEQPDKGRTIMDKLIEESGDSNYAIALLSPDDKVENGNARARQNVILEIGYFVGRLGKERVRLLRKGNVEIPSDLQGVLYENYDESGAWKVKLAKELQAVGIYVDMESVMNSI